MSIECIQHLENSYQLKQHLAIEQQDLGNNNRAIYYYVEAISRLELLCTSYNAHLKIGIKLHLQYIETNIKLANLYKKAGDIEKHLVLVTKTSTYINQLENILKNNPKLLQHIKQYKETLTYK